MLHYFTFVHNLFTIPRDLSDMMYGNSAKTGKRKRPDYSGLVFSLKYGGHYVTFCRFCLNIFPFIFFRAGPLRLMLDVAFALVLSGNDDGQAVFFAKPV